MTAYNGSLDYPIFNFADSRQVVLFPLPLSFFILYFYFFVLTGVRKYKIVAVEPE